MEGLFDGRECRKSPKRDLPELEGKMSTSETPFYGTLAFVV